MIPFKRSCRQVAALVIAREDRQLPLLDRVAVRLHMGICAACPKFERQVLLMRNALAQWRHYEDASGESGAASSKV